MDAKEAERIIEVTRQHLSSAKTQAASAADRDGHILAERWREMERVLTARGMVPLGPRRVLEVGCGAGGVLASLCTLGAAPDRLFGVDLVPERIELAKARYPFLQVSCENAEQMAFPDSSFDLVLCFTIFSSILAENSRWAVAREVLRVLAPGGAVLWYDMRVGNPRNRNVRGMRRRDIQRLFEDCRIDMSAITLLPPLARWIDARVPALYPLLAKFAPLRTHYLGLITRDAPKA